jgi:hypothetical protein
MKHFGSISEDGSDMPGRNIGYLPEDQGASYHRRQRMSHFLLFNSLCALTLTFLPNFFFHLSFSASVFMIHLSSRYEDI